MKKLTPQQWYDLFPERLKGLIPTHEPILEVKDEITCKLFILMCLDFVEPGTDQEEALEEFLEWLSEAVNPNLEEYKL